MNEHAALRTFVAVSLVAFAFAVPAMSVTPPQSESAASIKRIMQKYDITEQGLKASPLFFDNLDLNHDGYLSRSEVPDTLLHDLYIHFNVYAARHRLDRAAYERYIDWHIGQDLCRGRSACGAANPYIVAKGP